MHAEYARRIREKEKTRKTKQKKGELHMTMDVRNHNSIDLPCKSAQQQKTKIQSQKMDKNPIPKYGTKGNRDEKQKKTTRMKTGNSNERGREKEKGVEKGRKDERIFLWEPLSTLHPTI